MSKKVYIKKKFVNKYKKGYPLVLKEAIEEISLTEGEIVWIFIDNKKFLGTAIVGFQNKGIGWIISNEKLNELNINFFENKINKAVLNRKIDEVTCYRVFNGIADGFGGLTIDFYDENYVVSWYSKGIYKYKEYVYEILKKLDGFKALYEKKRFSELGNYVDDNDFISGIEEKVIIAKEYELKFPIHLNDGAMVGVFLDQREVRKIITQKYSKNKSVLNTFSYTGAFSVAAVKGGAINTTSVDVAKRSKAKTQEMFETNGIDANTQEIVVMDVFEYFKYALRKNKSYDLVVLDPPSFARTKKRRFSASKDYTELLKETIKITNENGVIVASTNCSSFNMKKFKGFIEKAFKEENKSYKIIEEFFLPIDFKTEPKYIEDNYLKVLFLKLSK